LLTKRRSEKMILFYSLMGCLSKNIVFIESEFYTNVHGHLYRAKNMCDDDTYITYHARDSPRQLAVSNWTLYVKISPYASYYRSRLLDLLTNSVKRRKESRRKMAEKDKKFVIKSVEW
jgi:hypothetical protein